MLTKTSRASPSASARRQSRSVCTSTPATAVDDDDGGVGDPQGGDRVGDEAGLARRVDQVDLAAVVLEAGDRGADRHLALLLVGLEVGDRACRRRRSQAALTPRPRTASPRAGSSCRSPGARSGRHCESGLRPYEAHNEGRPAGAKTCLQRGLQPHHGLGVQLGDARLGDAEHLADLAQGEVLVVVERDDQLLALGQGRRSTR